MSLVQSRTLKNPPNLTLVSQLEDALKTLNDRIKDQPSRYHHDRAEVLFRLGRFEESIRDYDSAVHFGWPHNANSCWERGLAQYYAGDFQSAAEQFERYHRVGALDIENGLWRLMCTAEDQDIDTARAEMLDYSRKVRPPFPELLKLYLGNGSVEEVLRQAREEASTESDLTINLFNAHYYVGKYFQMIDEKYTRP